MANECCLGQKEKWKMGTDFINLKKCRPKDDFPLPRIDTPMDFAA